MDHNEPVSRSFWRRPKFLVIVGLVAAAFIVGYWASGPREAVVTKADKDRKQAQVSEDDHEKSREAAKKPSLWTCSMHPQIRLPNPGKCPICFMDLIPLETEKETDAGVSLARYSMSEAARKLAEVETMEVKRERARVKVRMVGMVYEDETRIAALTSRVDGRLDEIYVNFTGDRVRKGDPMVKIWSPTLIKSQVELFETMRGEEQEEGVIKGAEEKLIQLGLTREQIEEIKEKKKAILYVVLKAPINGIVMKKNAVLGQFVKEGTEMYIINDLSVVWIKMDAYETDMPWIRYGQQVIFTTPAVPGRQFKGKVLFIDPTLDTKTRSVKIRVEADNPDLILKPGMFVSAELESEVDYKGRVIKPEWAGKYICPMHPSENPASEPGICPDSKLPLRPASAYGYLDEKDPTYPLVIPSTAPLITGRRAIVYVHVPGQESPTYEPRDVVLGPRAGDKYLVYEGLKEGDRVVTKGNFKIDSAMQILARPSMMGPGEGVPKVVEQEPKTEEETIEKLRAPHDFLSKLTPVIKEYWSLKEALVDEKVTEAAGHAANLRKSVENLVADGLDKKAREGWTSVAGSISEAAKKISEAADVAGQRKAFDPLSEAMVRMLMSFRHVLKEPVTVFLCTMAFDGQGAYWVEVGEEKRNPYFGRKPFKGQDMLQCGELQEKIPPETGPANEEPAPEKVMPTPQADKKENDKAAGPDTNAHGTHSN